MSVPIRYLPVSGFDPANLEGAFAIWDGRGQFFQDSSGVTPAAVGDVVGLWRDRVGRYDVVQGTTAAKPLRAANGITCDGVDDGLRLTTAGFVNAFSGQDVPFTAIYHRGSTSSGATVAGFGGSTSFHRINNGIQQQRRADDSTTVNSANATGMTQIFLAHRFNGTTLDLYEHSPSSGLTLLESAAAFNVGVATFTAWAVGAAATSSGITNRIAGTVKAVYLFSRALTLDEIRRVYDWSIAEYGL